MEDAVVGGVMGVDGCPGGWVGALWPASGSGRIEVLVAPVIRALVDEALRRGPLAAVGVDMPIGLPDDGPRRADVAARRALPAGRKSSVFPVPTRVACEAATWTEANDANKAACGKGVAHQTFGLVPKILDVDAYVRSGPPVPVVEVHPEVSFALLDPAVVVPPKRTAAGREARAAALLAAGLPLPALARGPSYAVDDLVDACVAAWTARRYAEGDAEPLPDPPEVFSDGLPAAIWR